MEEGGKEGKVKEVEEDVEERGMIKSKRKSEE